MKNIVLIVSSFFYLGYSPIAPGTVGTLGGVFIYGLEKYFHLNLGIELFIIFFIFILGVFVSSQTEKFLNKKDPSEVVIDEVMGFLITMFMIPFSWTALVVGFIFNRILDIWKPFPVRQSQILPGGWGIMVDDVISSVYANLLLRVVLWVVA